MPFCSECGAKLKSGANFCASCGAKQVEDAKIAAPTYIRNTTNQNVRADLGNGLHGGLDVHAQYKTRSTDGTVGFSAKSYGASQASGASTNANLHEVKLNHPSLERSWAKVRNRRDPTNWCVFSFEGKSTQLKSVGEGKGGVNELKTKLRQLGFGFGCLLVQGVDRRGAVECRRDKFVAFDVVGSSVPEYQRANFNFTKGKVGQFWGSTALSLSFRETELNSVLSPQNLGTELLRAGAAHKPTHYDFGGGQEFAVDALEDSSSSDSDSDFD